MKKIIIVTSAGIYYIDDEGHTQFINLQTCFENNLKDIEQRLSSRYTDKEREFWQRSNYVGVRFALSDPPALMFYTVPQIHFEFSTRDELDEILIQIKKLGWRTNDGE